MTDYKWYTLIFLFCMTGCSSNDTHPNPQPINNYMLNGNLKKCTIISAGVGTYTISNQEIVLEDDIKAIAGIINASIAKSTKLDTDTDHDSDFPEPRVILEFESKTGSAQKVRIWEDMNGQISIDEHRFRVGDENIQQVLSDVIKYFRR